MVSRAVKTTGGNETGNGREEGGAGRAKGRKARRAGAMPVGAAARKGGVAAVSKLGREVEMAVEAAALGTVFMTSAAHKEGGREGGRVQTERKKEGKQE